MASSERAPLRDAAAHRWWAVAWLVVVLALVGHNAFVWFVEQRVPETDVLALLPASEQDAAVAEATTRITNAAEQHVVALIGNRDWGAAKRAADAYTRVTGEHTEWLARADAALNSEASFEPWWSHRGVLLSAADRVALEERSPDEWARTALQGLSSPLGIGRVGAWQDDPFGLFGRWLQERAAVTPVRPVDGALRVSDGDMQYAVVAFTLSDQAFSLRAQRAVVPLLDRARQAALDAAPGTRVLNAGLIFFAADGARRATTEINTIGWGSLAGILLLMWFAFRSLRPIGLVVISLAVGMLGALSVSALLFDRLHVITLVFGASLVGVAEDYGIHYLSHRTGDHRDGWVVMRELLPGLGFALGTTVVAYLGLGLTPFPGLRQMAVFSAAGLVFAWMTVALWFPQLERRPAPATRFASWLGGTRARFPAFVWRGPWIPITIVGALLLGAGLRQLTTDDDIRLLQSAPAALIAEQEQVGRILHSAAPAQFFLVRGPTEDALRETEEALGARLDRLASTHILGGYFAIANWVPARTTQSRDSTVVMDRLYGAAGAAARLAGALGEGPPWVQAARARTAAASAPLTVEQWLASSASTPFRHLHLGVIGGQHASVVMLQDVDNANLGAVRRAADGLSAVTWVDKVADISALLGRHRRQMTWIAVFSVVGLAVLLIPRYGRRTWRILTPTALGALIALATFGMLGMPMHLFHVLALLLIVGMGVDYGIFLVEHRGEHQREAWLAVVVSSASTLLSFGLLGLSSTPALRAFGLTVLIGLTIVTFVAPCFCVPEGSGE